MVAYFLLWSAIVAEEKLEAIFEKEGLDETDKRKEYIQKNDRAAFLAGKLESARFFIANVLPITDGKISAIEWGDLSAWEIAESSF